MNHLIATDFHGRLIDAAAAVAVLLTVAALLVRATWQPAKRIWIIQVSLMAGLILASGAFSSSRRISLGILHRADPGNSASQTASAIEINSAVAQADQPKNSTPPSVGNSSRAAGAKAAVANTQLPPVEQIVRPSAPALAEERRPVNLGAWLMAIYGAIAAGMSIWLAMAQWKVRQLVRRATVVDEELQQRWQQMLDDLQQADRLPSGRAVRLLVSDDVSFPLAAGVVHPAVLLPRWLVDRHCDQLGPVLAHELAHVIRRDPRSRWLAAVFQIAFFYQPLYWWLRREMRLCQEYLADARAAKISGSPTKYAEQLVELLKAAPIQAMRLQPTAGIIEGRSQLYRRMQVLLDSKRKLDSVENWQWKAAIAVGMLSIAPALGMVSLEQGRPIENSNGEARFEKDRSRDARDEHILLVGTVVNERGKGIPGVQVLVNTWDYEQIRTDNDGAFRRTIVSHGKHPLIRFEKAGYSPLTVTDWTARLEESRWNRQQGKASSDNPPIVLSNKTCIEGWVGTPKGIRANYLLIRADQSVHSNSDMVFNNLSIETRADRDGHYKLLVEPDTYTLEVRAPGIGEARLPKTNYPGTVIDRDMLGIQPERPRLVVRQGETKQLSFQLEPGVDFRAKIVDVLTGKPVPRIRVYEWPHREIQIRSGADGVVHIPSMWPGEFHFRIDAPGYLRVGTDATPARFKRSVEKSNGSKTPPIWWRIVEGILVDLRPGMSEATIFLQPGATVSGRVLDPDGRPVRGATVSPALTGTGNSITGDTEYSVQTKSDGTFSVVLQPSDGQLYNLVAHDGAYQRWRQWANAVSSPFKIEAGQKTENITLRLNRPGSIRGRTLDEQGQPLANVYVKAQAADLLENRYYDPDTRSNQQGIFELRFVRPGEHTLRTRDRFLAFGGHAIAPVDVRTGETTDVGDVVVTPKRPQR
jgi:beta-lactamase regulating signal transducer with metallopeptidase domain/protocatechuate 3,4-dioxygenase beta subunit